MCVNKANDRFIEKLKIWAETREDIRGVWLIGSSAYRDVQVSDQWSDLDFGLFSTHPERYYDDMSWANEIHPLKIYSVTDFFGHAEVKTIQMHFTDHVMVDFGIFPPEMIPMFASIPDTVDAIRRGYKIILDKDGLLAKYFDSVDPEPLSVPRPLDSTALDDMIRKASTIFLHAARKLGRKDVYSSYLEIQHAITRVVFPLAIDYAIRLRGPIRLPYLGFKNFSHWSVPFLQDGLSGIFPGLDAESQWAAILNGIEYTEKLSSEIARRLGDNLSLAPLHFAKEEVLYLQEKATEE